MTLQLRDRFRGLHDFLFNKWYFDELFDAVFVRPITSAGGFGRAVVETRFVQGFIVGGATGVVRVGTSFARAIQTGYLRAYALLLLKTCHKRGAPAIGGMSALIPIKNDPEKNAIAMAGIINDKKRDATDGYDGGWVAHPGLVEPAMKEFVAVLGEKPNQFEKQRPDVEVKAADLLDFQPETPITEGGLRMNINVGIHYLGAWLAGNGCVPIHNLMEDAATAEISRSQVWQWIRSPKGKLEDGTKVTAELVRKLIPEELAKVKETGAVGHFDRAAEIFEQMSTSEDFAEFLTLPLYEEI